MSSDNFIAVFEDNDKWYVSHGMMPQIETPADLDQFQSGVIAKNQPFSSRADALIAAHDQVKKERIVEYGVIEL